MSAMTPEATDSSGVPGTSAQQIRLVPPGRARRSAWLVLRQPGFRLYFFGTLTSNLGTWFQSTGQIIIAFQISHSVFIVGLITSAQFAGMVFSPWAAVLADRIGTKTYLVSTQLASAGIALWMAWRYHSGLLGVHTLVFGALGLGLAYALALPVQTALVPALVDPADTTEAVRMNAVSYNVGRALAPALYVLVIGFLRPDLIFVFNAASFIVFACCLARVLGRLNHKSRQEHDRRGRGRDPDRYGRPHVTDGFRTALRHRRILLLLAIIGAVTFAEDPIFVLSPTLAHTALRVSTHWTGYFIAALGWGCVVGSLPPTSKKDDARRASRHAAIGLVLLSISVIVFTWGISAEISLLASFAAGAAGLYTGTAAQTALLGHQKKKAVVSVASVAALWAIAWAGTKPFASLLDGLLASHIGLVPTAAVLVLPALTIAFGEIVFRPALKTKINASAGVLISRLRLRVPAFRLAGAYAGSHRSGGPSRSGN